MVSKKIYIEATQAHKVMPEHELEGYGKIPASWYSVGVAFNAEGTLATAVGKGETAAAARDDAKNMVATKVGS